MESEAQKRAKKKWNDNNKKKLEFTVTALMLESSSGT